MSEQTSCVDLHVHTHFSDGKMSPKELVLLGQERGLIGVGISDHDTTKGVYGLEKAARIYNEKHPLRPILPLYGVEVSTEQGHVVVTKPGPDLDQSYLDWFDSLPPLPDIILVVNQATSFHNALVIIAHPNTPLIHSVSFNQIRELVQHLDPGVLKNLGIEVRNHSTQVMYLATLFREFVAQRLAKKLDLAQIGSTDAHAPWQIAQQYTTVPMPHLSAHGLMKAFQQRETRPGPIDLVSIPAFLHLLYTFFNLSLVQEKQT